MSKDTQIKTGFLEKQARENSKRGTSRGVMIFLTATVILALGFGIFKTVEMLSGFQTYQKIRNISIMLKDPKVENGNAYVNVSIKNLNAYPITNPVFKYDISSADGKELVAGKLKIDGSVPTADKRTFHHINLGQVAGQPAKLHSDLVDVKTTPPKSLPAGFNLKFSTALNSQDPLAELLKLKELAPRYAPLTVAIGIEQESQSNWDAALASFKEAVAQDSNLANAHYHLGLLLLRNKLEEEGAKELELAKQISPNDPDINNVLMSIKEPVSTEEE